MLDKLHKFYQERQNYFQEKFNRFLPFGDIIVDRWDKAKLLGFGENTSIYDSAIVYGDVSVGDNVWIGPNVILDGSAAPLVIGSYCSISANVQIYTHNSVGWALTGGKQKYQSGAVQIGSYVFIGPNSIISAGVIVEDKVVVGAQSFVNADVPTHTAVWGQPAKPQAKIIFTSETEYELRKDLL